MHITLLTIGKLKDSSLTALYQEYKKRLEWKVDLREVPSRTSQKEEETLLLCTLPRSSYTIALDEKGEILSSLEFANLLESIQLNHHGKLCFLIGGANGLTQEIKKKSQKSLAFGRMTWPHLLTRVLLMEQLYRAQQILKGHPYHRE